MNSRRPPGWRSGEVDMSTVGVLRAEVASRLNSRPAAFVIDLSDVDFFASTGISLLMETGQRTGRDGITFAVVVTRRHVLRSLEVTGTDNVLPLFGTLTKALATLSLHRPSAAVTPPAGEPVA
ncbi:STAS domain-containing protein [Saccharothrix carnea]|uniref:STAS domain-containing protein n=1 Tax=Saccharothrix carnea TaxID=1280637 RepID=UPI00237889B8|nr:STAS domain-containing protein [Saccharothrix sp. CB00851]